VCGRVSPWCRYSLDKCRQGQATRLRTVVKRRVERFVGAPSGPNAQSHGGAISAAFSNRTALLRGHTHIEGADRSRHRLRATALVVWRGLRGPDTWPPGHVCALSTLPACCPIRSSLCFVHRRHPCSRLNRELDPGSDQSPITNASGLLAVADFYGRYFREVSATSGPAYLLAIASTLS